jgi:hypothetical protein
MRGGVSTVDIDPAVIHLVDYPHGLGGADRDRHDPFTADTAWLSEAITHKRSR